MARIKKIKTSGKFKQSMGRKVTARSNNVKVSSAVRKARKQASLKRAPKKQKGLIALNPAKRFRQFMENYEDALRRGEIKPLKDIEALRNKYQWNKDGSVKASTLRSNKSRREFNEDIKQFNRTYKRWGKKAVKEIGEEQQRKTQERLKKGAETYKEKGAKELTQEVKEKGFDFVETTRDVFSEYYRMADIFAMDSYNKLAEQFNLGSKTPAVLASVDMSKDDMEMYLDDVLNAYKNMAKKAQKLAKQDEVVQAIVKMQKLFGSDNFTDTLQLFLEAWDAEEKERVIKMSMFYSDHKEETNKSMYDFYMDFRKASETLIDLDNEKTWGEYL